KWCDQKAAEDEEQIDAEESAARPVKCVHQDDRRDRDATHTIKFRPIPKLRGARARSDVSARHWLDSQRGPSRIRQPFGWHRSPGCLHFVRREAYPQAP